MEDLGLVIVHWGSEVGLVSERLGRTLCYLADARPPAVLVCQARKSLSLDELIEAVSDECRPQRPPHRDGRPQEVSRSDENSSGERPSDERKRPTCGNWEAAAHFLSRHLPGHRALLREV